MIYWKRTHPKISCAFGFSFFSRGKSALEQRKRVCLPTKPLRISITVICEHVMVQCEALNFARPTFFFFPNPSHRSDPLSLSLWIKVMQSVVCWEESVIGCSIFYKRPRRQPCPIYSIEGIPRTRNENLNTAKPCWLLGGRQERALRIGVAKRAFTWNESVICLIMRWEWSIVVPLRRMKRLLCVVKISSVIVRRQDFDFLPDCRSDLIVVYDRVLSSIGQPRFLDQENLARKRKWNLRLEIFLAFNFQNLKF